MAAAQAPCLDQSLSIFGHSMGAVIGFELAGRRTGLRPLTEILLVSGRRAPSCLREGRLHLAGDDAILAETKRLSGTDSRILGDEDVRRMVLPSLPRDRATPDVGQPRRAMPRRGSHR
ncbi:thioesterase domain-containing protein [Micromonospora rifamycinica]|uniref:thioesterase II family protein n=1 Tax=Micromonospora rifamycinica TaxID=291594 RepID=UPI0033E416E7